MSYCFVLQLDLLHQIMILKISWSRHISQGNNTGGSSKKFISTIVSHLNSISLKEIPQVLE